MERQTERAARLRIVLSMLIFGTIGLVRRYIPLPSGLLAQTRGAIGAVFLLLVMRLRREKLSWSAIRGNAGKLCLSGAMLGFNWILLFEAYRFTTVAAATICYYMAPVLVLLVSPLLGERLTLRKALCCAAAVAGMALVSGVLTAGGGSLRGALLGLGAAVLYAGIVLTNKRLRDIAAFDRTVVQLLVSSVVLLPYSLLTEDLSALSLTPGALALVGVAGVVHTGLAYALYFGSMKDVKAQTAALLSYIDPVAAVLLSALVLREPLGLTGVVGTVLVLGATVVSELPNGTRAPSRK